MLAIEFKGEISTPKISAKNSSISSNIEILEIDGGKLIRICKNPSEFYINKNNIDFYSSEKDTKGVPILNRIERYPTLPDDVFVPIIYQDIYDSKYLINKKGIVLRSKDLKIIKGTITKNNYKQISLINSNGIKKYYRTHRLVSYTFLINPNYDIYCFSNHINSNTLDCNLLNLEWVTESTNSIKRKRNKVTTKPGEKTEIINNTIKYSGNISDYVWYKHWKYENLWVCKEGFIRNNFKRIGTITPEGYIIIIYSNNKNITRIMAQRVIMEFLLNRNLNKDEIVDHINCIRHDNSFNNLRITDLKGNMNNKLTLEKYYKSLILSNLFGDFIMCDNSKVISEFIYRDSKKRTSYSLVNCNILRNNYICVLTENTQNLLKKMENIIYVFNKDKSEVIYCFTSLKEVQKITRLSQKYIKNCIDNKKLAYDQNYYMRGPEAVNLVISLGHGTAINFKSE